MGSYRERLLVPVSYWLLAVPSIAFLGAEAWFIAGGIVPPLTLAILSVIAAVFLINWGSATIEVTGGVLRAGKDTLLLSEAGEIVPLDEKQATLLRRCCAAPGPTRPPICSCGPTSSAPSTSASPIRPTGCPTGSSRPGTRTASRPHWGMRGRAPAGRAVASGNPWDDCAITQGGEEATDE